LTSAPTNGDVLILTFASSSTTVFVSSITETGVTWTSATQNKSGNGDSEIWYGTNVSGAASAVTLNLSGTGPEVDIANVSEWAGVATSGPVDSTGTANASNASSTAVTAGTVTPTNSGDLMISAAYIRAGSTTQLPPSNSFAALTPGTVSGNYRGYGAYYVEPGRAAISTTWTGPSSNKWAASIAGFLP